MRCESDDGESELERGWSGQETRVGTTVREEPRLRSAGDMGWK